MAAQLRPGKEVGVRIQHFTFIRGRLVVNVMPLAFGSREFSVFRWKHLRTALTFDALRGITQAHASAATCDPETWLPG